MRQLCLGFTALMLAAAGCSQAPTDAPTDSNTAGMVETPALGEPAAEAEKAMTAAATASTVTLSPENTSIQFVGLHTDPAKPDPRLGFFAAFTGRLATDDSGVQAIQIEIDTASLSTEIDKLTNHLKSADFFNVNEHPQATFTSTKIEPAGAGQVTVTGDLTLLGNTQSISFPAMVSTDGGVSLKAEFKIDRTRFGMNYGTDNVARDVDMTITVDE